MVERFRQCSKENTVRGSSAERAVRATCIEELELAGESGPGVRDRLVRTEIDLFIFDRAPEPFDEHVVAPAPGTVHSDRDLPAAQHVQELGAGELAALIGVEDLRRAEARERLLERGDAEVT